MTCKLVWRMALHAAVRRGSNCPRLMPCRIFELLLVATTHFDRVPHLLCVDRDTLLVLGHFLVDWRDLVDDLNRYDLVRNRSGLLCDLNRNDLVLDRRGLLYNLRLTDIVLDRRDLIYNLGQNYPRPALACPAPRRQSQSPRPGPAYQAPRLQTE